MSAPVPADVEALAEALWKADSEATLTQMRTNVNYFHEVAHRLLAAGYVSPADHARAVREAKAEGWDDLLRLVENHAYNGAEDLGQRFYDWGLNPWLRGLAAHLDAEDES